MKQIITILVLLILLLSACNNQEPTATATTELATAVPPTAEPTEEMSEVEAEAEILDLGALTAHPWQWLSFTSPVDQFDLDLMRRL